MRDLVESVIDSILAQERRQAPRSHQAPRSGPAQADFRTSFDRIRKDRQDRHPAETRFQSPAGNPHPDSRLWEVSLKFEGQFIEQMLHAMRSSIPKSGLLPHGFAQDVQDSMMDQAIAETAGRRGEFGIAESIYRQMSRAVAQDHANPADKAYMAESIASKLEHPVDQATEAIRHAR